MRMRRWTDNGVWTRVLEALQIKLNISIDVTALSLDSTSIKVHPDGTGALKKRLTSHRPKSRRSEHENSLGRRKRNNACGIRQGTLQTL